jgi:transcriptional regulator with XRE-family HTH domain
VIHIRQAEVMPEAIVFARHLAGLTQRQLAAKAGFRQAQIAAWEVGAGRPNVASTVRLFDALGYQLALVPKDGQRVTSPAQRAEEAPHA